MKLQMQYPGDSKHLTNKTEPEKKTLVFNNTALWTTRIFSFLFFAFASCFEQSMTPVSFELSV